MDLETIFQGQMNQHKWKMLGDYLKSQKVHPGAGLRLENSGSNGISISAVKQRQPRPTQSPPFSVLSLRKIPATSNYAVELQEGIVLDRYTQQGVDAVEEHFPTIGGDPMSDRPRPELTITDGDIVACTYTTDSEGFIDIVPRIVVNPVAQDSDHHQPPSGESIGSEGNYWIKLFKFEVDDGAPKFTIYQQSDIEHTRLPSFRNIGAARYIHKEWKGADDRYDFRTLKQVDIPSGRTGGKVLVDPVGPEIDAVNDSLKFSCIVERATNPQVRVNDDGAGVITVEGNGVSESLVFKDCDGLTVGTLTWVDGLITSAGFEVTLGECSTPT